MIKSENFYVKSRFMKSEDFDFAGYVRTLVRHEELASLEGKKSVKDAKEAIVKAHPDTDPLTCNIAIVNDVLKEDAGQFLKDRAEILTLKEEIESLPVKWDDVSALCPTDAAHVRILAHIICPKITLSEELFDPEKGGADLIPAVTKFYTDGKMRDVKDLLKAALAKVFGDTGEHFHAVKLTRADFADEDVRHFCADFTGAKRDKVGKDKKEFSDFHYFVKSDKKTCARAFTRLCAVVLDNSSKRAYSVPVKAEEKSEKKAV